MKTQWYKVKMRNIKTGKTVIFCNKFLTITHDDGQQYKCDDLFDLIHTMRAFQAHGWEEVSGHFVV